MQGHSVPPSSTECRAIGGAVFLPPRKRSRVRASRSNGFDRSDRRAADSRARRAHTRVVYLRWSVRERSRSCNTHDEFTLPWDLRSLIIVERILENPVGSGFHSMPKLVTTDLDRARQSWNIDLADVFRRILSQLFPSDTDPTVI